MMMNSTQQYNVDDAYDNDNDDYDHDDDDCRKTVFETNKQSPQNEQLAFGLPNNPPHTTNYPQGLKNVYETDRRGNEVFLPNILTRLGNIFCGRDHFLCVKANDQSWPPLCRNVHKDAACCWFEHLW